VHIVNAIPKYKTNARIFVVPLSFVLDKIIGWKWI